MSQPQVSAFSWDHIRLVVFDVDGTLYRQSPLRLRMARDMLLRAARSRNWTHIKVLKSYRKIREELGEAETGNFEPILIQRTAAATGASPDYVSACVTEWMEDRPLAYIKSCRYPGLVELFSGLRAHAKRIGILSDYPVQAKLDSLGLSADYMVSAVDPEVGILKPNPRGLQHVIAAAGVRPAQTVLIGDRTDRDGLAARRASAHVLIRSNQPQEGFITFKRFDDALFDLVLKV